jgi:hypothetical protein
MPILGIIASSQFVEKAAGYFADYYTTNQAMKKLNYTNETYSSISQNASFGDYGNASNSPTACYKFGTGGSTSSAASGNQTFKFTFAGESLSVLGSGSNTYSCFNPGGTTNNGTCAYIVGGMTTATTSGLSTTNKMPYSNDTTSSLGTTLSAARGGIGGVYNANTAGYFAGGTSDNGPTLFNTINKMTFSTDTMSTLGATLSQNVAYNPTSHSTYASTSGFFWGGYNQSPDSDVIARLTFSSETRDNPATLASPSRANGTVSKDTTAAYFNPGTGATTTTQKLVYSSTTRTTLAITSGTTVSQGLSNQG